MDAHFRLTCSLITAFLFSYQLKDILDLNRIMEIARDNIGSVVAIIESLLLIIRTNVNSVFNFVTGSSLHTVDLYAGLLYVSLSACKQT